MIKIQAETNGLCGKCKNSMIIKQRSGTVIICSYAYPSIRLYEPVDSCSKFEDRSTPHKSEFEATAWTLRTEKNGRMIGFEPPTKKRDDFGD